MKLELNILNLKEIQFEEKTAINNGVLHIEREAVCKLLAEDKRFSQVDIDIVRPGESCRVVQVFDVVEPRAKIGEGEDFPGIFGQINTVGYGKTCVLRGMSIVPIDYTAGPRCNVMDMTGWGGQTGAYSKLCHLILLCKPAAEVVRSDYHNALRIAGIKVAVFLAKLGANLSPDEIETYNLETSAYPISNTKNLPRVAYICQIHALQQGIVANEPIFYGDNVARMLPTIIHPNEMLDGAIVRNYWARNHETFSYQNNPIIRELYQRNGKDLYFVGAVITVAQSTETERKRNAILASKLVKFILGADGVIITKTGGGAPHIDMAETCESCEKLGIKTALIVQDESRGESSDGALLFNKPYMNAVVNVGSFERPVVLPSVNRVVGGPVTFSGNRSDSEQIEIATFALVGSMNQVGLGKLMESEI